MLLRVVRMTFRPDAVDLFLPIFDRVAPEIRAFSGCRHLELWRSERYPNILTTYSHWEDARALRAYRESRLFEETWASTRSLFAAPPQAHSYVALRSGTDGERSA